MEQTQAASVKSFSLSNRSTLAQVAWIIGFAFCTGIAAQIEIPHNPVPYTLQTFVVLLSGAFLGKRNGLFSQSLYILIGIAGVPVFSGWGSGAVRLIGPTGGYLLSFPVAAFVVGYLLERNTNFVWSLISMTAGLFVVFSLGTLHLNFVFYHNWSASIANGFLLFTWWDIVKIVGAALVYRSSRKFLNSIR